MTDNERYARGRAKLSEVTGETGENVVDMLGDLGRYIVEFAYGDIYNRETLTLRERQIATIAVLTVLGRETQLRIHLQASLNAGLTPKELEEIILHTVLYAGFPTAINATRVLQKVVAERENDANTSS